MKSDLLLTLAGAALGAAAVAVHKLAQERQAHAQTQSSLARIRARLAAALDTQAAANAAAAVLQRGIVQRDTELADAQAQLGRAADAVQNLIKALNSANVRCAELQQALDRHGLSAESAYFAAVLSDGTIAGPFSRN